MRARRELAYQNDVFVRLGNSGVVSIAGPIAGRSSASSSLAVSTRIAHCGLPIETCWKRQRAAGLDLAAAVVRAVREVLRPQARAAHVHAAGRLPRDRRADLARGGLDRERVGVGPAAPAQVEDRLARAVARQLGLRAVGVEDPQPGDEAGLVGRGELEHAVARRARSAGRTAAAPAAALSSNGSSPRLHDQVVVAEGLPLLEAHARPSCRARPRSSLGDVLGGAPGDVDRRARPRACASRSAGAWRSGASAPFIASTSPASSASKPSAWRAPGEAPAASARADLLARPRPRPSRPRAPRSARRAPRGPSSGPPSSVGRRSVRRPQLRVLAPGGRRAGRRRAARARGRCAGASCGRIASAAPGARRASSACSAARRRASSCSRRRARIAGRRAGAGRAPRARRAGTGRCRRRRSGGGRWRAAPSISACAARANSPALEVAVSGSDADQPVLEPRPARPRWARR